MAALTLTLSGLLIVLGLVGFVLTGLHAPTALIPSICGLLFLVFGLLARSPDPKRRMLWAHVAVTLALVLFLGTVKSVIDCVKLLQGAALARPAAAEEKAAMSTFCLVYVLFAIRSFVSARRQRQAA